MSLFVTVALPIALIMDHGQDEGITKKECPTCKGVGYLVLD
jgi:hypothetical protein